MGGGAVAMNWMFSNCLLLPPGMGYGLITLGHNDYNGGSDVVLRGIE